MPKLEFFAATIRNRAVQHFFAWSEHHQLGGLNDIEPLHIAAYVEQLQASMAKPSVKQHLAAIRMLFDWLVTGGVLATNPAHAVCGPKHVVKRGKTPVLTSDQARELLDRIDASTLIGLRDRALIGVMTYAFARVGAVIPRRSGPLGYRCWPRLERARFSVVHIRTSRMGVANRLTGIRAGSGCEAFGKTGAVQDGHSGTY